MGLGDDVLATVWAREIHRETGNRVAMGHSSPVFENNPDIGAPGIPCPHRPGHRPYIIGRAGDRFLFNPNHVAKPGHIHLTESEIRDGPQDEGFILIEPHVKGTVSADNKDWGWAKWKELAAQLPDLPLRQIDYGKPILPGVEPVKSGSFRHALVILYRAGLFVGTDGGLHHAAAAFNKPAVVIWGHYSSPDILGYRFHENIWHGEGPCGSLVPCNGCREAMDRITIDEVEQAVRKAYDGIPEKEDTGRDQAQPRRAVQVGAA